MSKAQKIWDIIRPRLEIEVRRQGDHFYNSIPGDVIVKCPMFLLMQDSEFDKIVGDGL